MANGSESVERRRAGRRLLVVNCVVMLCALTMLSAIVFLVSRDVSRQANKSLDAADATNSSDGANQAGLPKFALADGDLARIQQVIGEVRTGYGGTLVVSPHDRVLDSSAFLAYYLRAFSRPNNTGPDGTKLYDYRFERILSRFYESKALLDQTLDMDVWNSYLAYEDAYHGQNSYQVGDTVYGLDSAKDLLLIYLEANAEKICQDATRRKWWIERLTSNFYQKDNKALRRWYLLQLVSSTDTKTEAKDDFAAGKEAGEEPPFQMMQPTPHHPYLKLDSRLSEEYWRNAGIDAWPSAEIITSPTFPLFADAIAQIANSQKLQFEVWDIDPQSMPPSRARLIDVAPRMTQIAEERVFDQESWSTINEDYAVRYARVVGSRSAHVNGELPAKDRKDGVFFFTYNARLYVWPKARMEDGVIQMLHISKLVDDSELNTFRERGFKELKVSLKSPDVQP